MKTTKTNTFDRRLAIGGSFAAMAALAAPRGQTLERAVIQRGIAGGGLVRFADGEARFSLLATRLTTMEDGVESEPIFLGRLRWEDGSVGVTLESVRITNYENLGLATGQGRRVEGIVAAGESGEQPFLLEATFDLPDSQPDLIVFRVGAANAGAATPGASAGYTYAADGEVVGDIIDADSAVDLETGDVTEPEPE